MSVPQTQDITVIDVDLFAAAMSGTTITVEFGGRTYTIEEWATDSTSGVEVYDESGDDVSATAPDAVTDFDSNGHPALTRFYERYQNEVVPLIERLKAECFQVPQTHSSNDNEEQR